MRKIICIIVMIFLLTSCTSVEKKAKKENVKKQEEVVEKYIDDNPITIGIYENNSNLVKDFKTTKENFKDIVFSVYYTQDSYLENNTQKYNWNKYYTNYENIDNYKIGYAFSFYVGDTFIEKTILEPDTFAFNPYFYIYLYDDIHQTDGVSYSHLEREDVNENTIFSSIKIYLVESEKITSPIELTAFTYNDKEDFDEENKYRGKSFYRMKIDWE